MKKLFMILFASTLLVACGGGSNQSEANQEDAELNTETTEPAVTDDNMRNESDPAMDTTGTMSTDTTGTSTQGTTANP